jgi:hypothetical protein
VKIGVKNQQQKEKQHEQSSGDCQQQEENDRDSVLPRRANQRLPPTDAKAARIASHGRMLNAPTLPPAASKKKKIVAVARQLAVDLWRARTGRCKAQALGLVI